MAKLRAVSLICTLSPSPSDSSSELIANDVQEELSRYDVEATQFRIADYSIKFGIKHDMGDGDQWSEIRQAILKADILLISTPIWLGQPSAIAKMILERLNADLSETNNEGRPVMYGKVGIVAVVGNEDGAHHVSAEMHQALSDIGFTIPAGGPTYWVGEAMGSTDYKDLASKPKKTVETNKTISRNAVHLARLLKEANYPVG